MRIVIRVIANPAVGLGHAYRALTLAKQLKPHEVRFVSSHEDAPFISQIVKDEFAVSSHSFWLLDELIPKHLPDLVINDILDTLPFQVEPLQERGVKVVNFEDLGPGAEHADLVVNALFQEPQREGGQYLWGSEHFFLREEFEEVGPNEFQETVDSVLVTYGGADPLNLTLKTLRAVWGVCTRAGLRVFVVVGPAYQHEGQLMDYLLKYELGRVFLVKETGYMAKIMSRCQVAFTGNGRTVYELAHMNVPTVVTAQSGRENTHDFAVQENGFYNLGVFDEEHVEWRMRDILTYLIRQTPFRKIMHDQMAQWDFCGNAERVARRILEVADAEKH